MYVRLYVRLLKGKGIAVIFDKENINTLTEQGKMMLTLMGTLAQNGVESTSKNVKLGIKMKMKRGELMGFNGCLRITVPFFMVGASESCI